MSSTALPMTTTEMKEGSDAYLGTGAPRISKEQLKQLSEVSSFWPTVHIALEYGLMFGMAWLCNAYFNPLLYIITVIVIGSRLHGLGVLLHDCAHYRLFKNRKLNDIVGEVLLAWPLLITMYGYRRNHFNHHRYLNTEQDPDYVRKNRWQEYRMPKTAKE